jgi:hypothetical protein
MSLRGIKVLLQVALCAVLTAGSAHAVTIVPTTIALDSADAALHPLGNGQVYSYNSGDLSAGTVLNLYFSFSTLADALVTITSGDQPNVVSKITNLTLTWLNSSGTAIAGGLLTIPAGSQPESTLALALGTAGDYFLHVTGNVINTGSTFVVEVSTTPIPPALLLFGSALAGLGFLGRRSRRSPPSPLA